MAVVITCSSFCLDRSAAPARVAMTMIVFLANTNFLVAQLGQLPRLGNDVWLLRFLTMSTYFSFYGVLEYCLGWYENQDSLFEFCHVSATITFSFGVGIPGIVWESKQPQWIEDISQTSQRRFLRRDIAWQLG